MSLQLTDVRLTYSDGDSRLVALDDITVQVAPGELVAVTGPSGSGKSSLLAVAGLLTTPEAGRVRIGGTDTSGLRPSARDRLRRERIGFVFQQANLPASLTALDQLLLVADLAGRVTAHTRRRAHDLLDRVGLAAKSRRRPHELSGGQRQRVGIARALMGQPMVLLVDEPTSALDHDRGRAVVDLIRTVTRENGIATVMVTHDLTWLDLMDRTVTMRDGTLTAIPPKSAAAPFWTG